MTEGHHSESPIELGQDFVRPVERQIADEVAVALSYNGVAHVVMFMSPLDVEDFVIGFSVTEGIIDGAEGLSSFDLVESEKGLLANAVISEADFEKVLLRRRNLPGQSGCGICGVVELEQAMRPLQKTPKSPDLDQTALFAVLAALKERQVLNQVTHSVHAAAFVGRDGEITALREDIGRHNALDKLIGALARNGVDMSDGFVVMTSRCSVELVQKAVAAKIGLLVTVSAPTGLALELARESGLGLICVARQDSVLVYNDPAGQFNL